MRVMLEGQKISNSDIEKYIPIELITNAMIKTNIVDLVGYIRNTNGELCMILPKVFDSKIIDEYEKANSTISEWMSNYCITLYRILKKYRTSLSYTVNSDNTVISNKKVTYIDALLSLLSFYRKHKYLYVLKKINSSSNQPVNAKWEYLINKNKSKIIDDNIFFDEFENKKLSLSYEDFLLKLLNTEIYYISQKYGLYLEVNKEYMLTVREYRQFIKKPLSILKRNKRNYYRDDFLKLYKTLYNYYSLNEQSVGKDKCEYLVSNSFQLVFETMIDDLLSSNDLVNAYKYNKDGKIIDHIYSDIGLFFEKESIYIGDSKYYKDDINISSQRWKQYSYSRNITNYILTINNAINNKFRASIRDEKLYGYHVIPNFFITAFVNDDPTIRLKNIFKLNTDRKPHKTEVFKNRLFDRETLHILYFKMDLITLGEKYLNGWKTFDKTDIKKYIRDCWIEYINQQYLIYEISISSSEIVFFIEHYYLFEGKIILVKNETKVILALEATDTVIHDEIVDILIKNLFKLKPIKLL